ncbi:MAG: hypothetical protein PF448_06100 [Bacteroidales bacterium]|jgi:hypothetical protein|nr:hypothetical protein [Bacteroidales bacterium]
MKFSHIIIIAITVSLAVSACVSKEEKADIKQVKNMLNESKSAQETLNGPLLDSVKAYLDSAKMSLQYFKTHPEDTLPIEAEMYWEAYYHILSVEKMLGNFKDKHLPQINKDLELLQTQLTNLQHDIKKRLLEDSLRQEYITREDSAYQFIMHQVEDRIKHSRAHFEKYEANKADLKSLEEIMKD